MGSKFSDPTCEKLWDITLDGCHDEETGHVDEQGWYGLLTDSGVYGAEHAIVGSDSQGFVTYSVFASADEARKAFAEIERELEELDEDAPPPEEDEEPEEEAPPAFTYHVNLDERGVFDADVRGPDGATVYEFRIEDEDDMNNPIVDGYMKHGRDIDGLREYLVELGTMPDDATLTLG